MKKYLVISVWSFFFFSIFIFIYSLTFSVSFERLVFLDVGQGDSILIESKNGNQLLLDSGRGKEVIPELREVMKYGDKHIDVIMASHFDADHIGGFEYILDSYDIGLVLINGAETTTKTASDFLSKAKSKNIPVKIVKSGEVIDLGNNVVLKILFPFTKENVEKGNEGSIVARVQMNKGSFLLTGDATQKVEAKLISKFKNDLQSDVLKLGHHGSKTSSSKDFLNYVKPKVAIISAGKNNQYGHPSKETIDRLKSLSIPFLSTITLGRIEF